MSDLNIKAISINEANDLDNYDISLKRDGTLIYYTNGELISPRCNRSERYSNILNILKKANFPDCMGEMFIDEEGSNVFDISRKENWAKAVFMPFDIILNNASYHSSYFQRLIILDELVKRLNNPFIIPMMRFETFKEGWDYVLRHKSEGLVLRNNSNWYKCKILQEAKIEIKEHEPNKEKGTFILINGNRVSGTSKDFVRQFHEIKSKGNIPLAEIEYAFLTSDEKMFQPRLRQIIEA